MLNILNKVSPCTFILFLFLGLISNVRADSISELQGKIAERNQIILTLEKEIALYQSEVEKTSSEAKNLKNTINALELTRKKLNTEIKLQETRIASTNLTIQELNVSISNREAAIKRNLKTLSTVIQKIAETDSNSLLESLLNYKSLGKFWNQLASLNEFDVGLRDNLKQIRALKQELEDKNKKAEGKKRELISQTEVLGDKKKVADYNKIQTAKLLSETNNKESNYRKVLNQKIALRDAFEQELLEYESKLKFAIDPKNLPSVGSGVLRWPVDSPSVTQYFGNTDFSNAHRELYSGRGHNGIDLRAAVGTSIKAALSGRVVGTGNTDETCPGASYGKWVLIEHGNGLSTLYAHLSVIKVSAEQNVATEEIIGYSGDTGYATGPHLHFTVYATQGVRILSRPSKVCNATYTMPVGSLNAYLNPLSYL